MNIPIVFEDEAVLLIDKPSGIIVNRSEQASTNTLQDWSSAYLRIPSNRQEDFYSRGGIVHRLDRETSGLLLIGKTEVAFQHLQTQFANRTIEKHYTTLVHGKIGNGGTIKAPVGRLPWNRRKFGVHSEGRASETSYRVLKQYTNSQGGYYTLLEVKPLSGRTHQIRVHLAHIGYPVVSDALYTGNNQAVEDKMFCPRLFLHASFLRFLHPLEMVKMEFERGIPKDLQLALNKLQPE